MHGQGLKIMNIQPFYVFFFDSNKTLRGGGGEGGGGVKASQPYLLCGA